MRHLHNTNKSQTQDHIKHGIQQCIQYFPEYVKIHQFPYHALLSFSFPKRGEEDAGYDTGNGAGTLQDLTKDISAGNRKQTGQDLQVFIL